MNLRDLEYLVSLVDKRHFGLAAKACHVSQPALSSQIKKLEEELDLKLFLRTSTEVVPTENAHYIIENARVILEKAALIKKHALFSKQHDTIRVMQLGVIPTIAPYYLSSFFKRIGDGLKSSPRRWQIAEEKTPSLLEKLEARRLDCAIMVLPDGERRFPSKVIFKEPLYLAVATASILARRRSVSPEDIKDEEWLLLDDGHCLNVPMLDMCKRASNNVQQHSFRATSLETLRHMVASQSGITLMPEMARRRDDGITYIPLKNPERYHRAVSLVWRNDSLRTDEVDDILRKLSKKGP